MKKDNSKSPVRWYKVIEDCGCYIVSARSHSRARLQWGWHITGHYEPIEAMTLPCTLCKELNALPEHAIDKEGEIFDDAILCLKLGIFYSSEETGCPDCGQRDTIYAHELFNGETHISCCDCYEKYEASLPHTDPTSPQDNS